mmetsp:Transcript_14837/g.26307  ORF Transcript_14837/g.26307 Transcript_14837/m.26307 type:complete len:610 (-) Transcript_14837:30-1859(-)
MIGGGRSCPDEAMASAQPSYKYWLVMDFEATCEKDAKSWPNEIIEFPACLVDPTSGEIVDEFRSMVRPTERPILTAFCTELTSITQDQVDSAPALPEVLSKFDSWLASHGISESGALSCWCGDWDLRTCLPRECARKGLRGVVPPVLRECCNVKIVFCEIMGTSKRQGMDGMLDQLGIELVGHHHLGIDDSRNIAKIAVALAERAGRESLAPTTHAARKGAAKAMYRVGSGLAHACEQATETALAGQAAEQAAPPPAALSPVQEAMRSGGGSGRPSPSSPPPLAPATTHPHVHASVKTNGAAAGAAAEDVARRLPADSLVDIGVNLTHKSFKKDAAAVVARAAAARVSPLLLTGTSVKKSRESRDLAHRLSIETPAMMRDIQAGKIPGPPELYFTSGVHPHDAKSWTESTKDELREMAADSRCVAVGECGLDFNRDFSPRDVQEHVLKEQLELACELDMPLFLHERDAHERMMVVMGPYLGLDGTPRRLPPAVIHCFTGSAEAAATYVQAGLYVGLTGTLCMASRGKHLREEVLPVIPLDRLMLETDAPFMFPTQGNRSRCEPHHTVVVCEKVAEVLGVDFEVVAASTTANARAVFRLDHHKRANAQKS